MVFLLGRDGLKISIKPHRLCCVCCLEPGTAATEGAMGSQFVPSACAQCWLQPALATGTKTKGSPTWGAVSDGEAAAGGGSCEPHFDLWQLNRPKCSPLHKDKPSRCKNTDGNGIAQAYIHCS